MYLVQHSQSLSALCSYHKTYSVLLLLFILGGLHTLSSLLVLSVLLTLFIWVCVFFIFHFFSFYRHFLLYAAILLYATILFGLFFFQGHFLLYVAVVFLFVFLSPNDRKGWWRMDQKAKTQSKRAIGHFSKAGLLEYMCFVIFHKRSRERSECTSGLISE